MTACVYLNKFNFLSLMDANLYIFVHEFILQDLLLSLCILILGYIGRNSSHLVCLGLKFEKEASMKGSES